MNRIARHKKGLLAVAGSVMLLAACTSNPNAPGVEYMPDMYRSLSHETYGQYASTEIDPETGEERVVMKNTARQPVEGTVPRGWYSPFPYEDTQADRDLAAVEVKSPFSTEEKLAYLEEGKVAYNKFCSHCHGMSGKGDGAVVKKGEHAPPQAYSEGLKDLSEGQIYTAIMLGKGMMGSHASQIEEPDRWKIVAYVQTLQGKTIGDEGAAEEAEMEEGATEATEADAPGDDI